MRKIALLLIACYFLTACGTTNNGTSETVSTSMETTETIETTESTDTTETTESEISSETVSELPDIISPLPETIDIDNLEDGTYAISLEKGDIYVDENGIAWMNATIYTYDLYDMVDIGRLEEGHTISIRGEEIEVTSLESDKAGNVFINGGLDNGGYNFYTDENGVYYEHGYSDTKYWQELGEVTIKISEEFEFVDESDLDSDETIYHLEDLLNEKSEIRYDFTPHNAKIVIEDEKIITMTKTYAP